MEVTDSSHPESVVAKMYHLWRDDLYCDVSLKCESISIKAHKIVLATLSDYFKNIFKYNGNHTDQIIDEYDLDGDILKAEYLQCIVNFGYTGKIKIDCENVQDLLIAASFLQIKFVLVECEKFMANNLEIDNVIQLVPFANQFNLKHLHNSICTLMSEKFHELCKSGAFFKLGADDFKTLVKDVNFSVFDHERPVQNPELDILKLVGMYLSIASVTQENYSNSLVSALVKEIHFEDIPSLEDLNSVLDLYPMLDCSEIREVMNTPVHARPKDKMPKRKFSNSCKKLKDGRSYANEGQENNVLEKFDEVWKDGKDINDRPVRFTLWIRRWDGRPVLGGIAVQYKSGKLVQHGGKPNIPNFFVAEHSFSLEENEVITMVTVRSGFMIDNLKFQTNFGRIFGPFGGPGGGERTETCPDASGYLHSLGGKVVLAQGYLGITCLKFVWVTFGDDAPNTESENDEEETSEHTRARNFHYACRF